MQCPGPEGSSLDRAESQKKVREGTKWTPFFPPSLYGTGTESITAGEDPGSRGDRSSIQHMHFPSKRKFLPVAALCQVRLCAWLTVL